MKMLQALGLEPASANAYSGLSHAAKKLGLLDEALKHFRICASLYASAPSCRRHYVRTLGHI